VASYLTIPEIVESEPMLSLSAAADGFTFSVTISANDTASRLMRASQVGELIPLVVLTTDAQMLALDDVYVTQVSLSGDMALVEFLARGVRVV
jgi:hypothetical protein